jgi:hypothetical protein
LLSKNVAINREKLVRYARIKVAADKEPLTRSSADEHAKAAIYYRVPRYYGLDHEKVPMME